MLRFYQQGKNEWKIIPRSSNPQNLEKIQGFSKMNCGVRNQSARNSTRHLKAETASKASNGLNNFKNWKK